ncbi:unnamed protein product [Caenorhabditis angaria]|uniref:Uncharacterized protein n=1 Tax=Caenorhabditis angaria TaxID=860376 RepID=A0A9P1N3Y9_9PELO|nr:unnamed protein product [Caenorhabditis angaria]
MNTSTSEIISTTLMSIIEYAEEDLFDEVTTKKSSSRTFPTCSELLCDVYFTPRKIISIAIMLGRLTIALLIILLGTKMEKDFMRSISNAIFIPIIFTELYTVYIEVAFYRLLFAENKKDYDAFMVNYITWTDQFMTFLNDYVHINIMCLLPLILYCGRIATLPADRINAFPTNTICLIMQIIPFFVSILNYINTVSSAVVLALLATLSQILTIICFSIIFIQIFWSMFIMMRDLPYEAATSTDMQIRDARSRLAWSLAYMVIPFLTLIPFVIEAIFVIFKIVPAKNGGLYKLRVIMEILIIMIHFYRPTWMVLITMIFLPPYRRAVPLLFCCCSCCPKVDVEPLPRKAPDTSLMYKYADI